MSGWLVPLLIVASIFGVWAAYRPVLARRRRPPLIVRITADAQLAFDAFKRLGLSMGELAHRHAAFCAALKSAFDAAAAEAERDARARLAENRARLYAHELYLRRNGMWTEPS